MAYLQTVPLVIYVLGGGLLGLIFWGFIRIRTRKSKNLWSETSDDDPLLWLLVLAAFSMGVFITYVIFGFPT